MTGKESSNRLSSFLTSEMSPEDKQRLEEEAKFLAFYSHMYVLGQERNTIPLLHKGSTTISVPAFYGLKGHGKNPINKAALELLPRFSYKDYDEGRVTSVDGSGLAMAMEVATKDEMTAARAGKGASFIVARELGLQDPIAQSTYKTIAHGQPFKEADRLKELDKLVADTIFDLREQAVGSVEEIYAREQEKGHNDFLDYLVDVRGEAAGRITTLFAYEAQIAPPQGS